MARRPGTKPIYYHLPEDHPALAALDAYCAEWDKSRADASKDIVIAWAKARAGDLSALSGLLGRTLGAGAISQAPAKSEPAPPETGTKLKRSPSRNAQSVDLDL